MIRVKHAPSAAAIGESAYTIGRGQKRRWSAEMDQKQQALDLQGASIALQAKARAEVLEQRKKEYELRKEQDAQERADAERKRLEEPSRQLQMGLQQQELLRKNIIWEYDESQKREMAKITKGVAWLREQVAAGKWTAEQAEQAEQQLWQKYYSIIPLPIYDDKAKPQEMYNSRIVTDPITGARSMMDDKGNFTEVPGGIKFSEYSNFYADTLKAMFKQDMEGNDVTDYAAVDKAVLQAITRYSQIQGLAAKAAEQKSRQQPYGPQEEPLSPQQKEKQQAEIQAAVEALPTLFNTLIKGQPKTGRIKKGKPSGDSVYGEEAYNNVITEAISRAKRDGIEPELIKAELDKWWDAQHDKERGQMFQKFENRMEFKGMSRDTKPADRKVIPEVPMPLDEFASKRVEAFKSGKIVWTAIRKRFGQETADELKYICNSGNEQAIANALRRLGII